jgi:hypothetical protein
MDFILATSSGSIGGWALIGIEGLALLFWLWMGFIYLRHPKHSRYQSLRRQMFQAMQWQKQLRQWGIVLEQEQVDITIQELQHSWNTVQPFFTQYSIILVALLSFLINTVSQELSLQGQPQQVNQFWTFTTLAILFLALLLIRAGSYIVGVERLRRLHEHTISYSDLQRRNTTNYRHWLFRVLSIALVATILVTGALLQTSLYIQNTWILIVLMLLMCGVCATGELLIQRIAIIPRSLVTSKPVMAREVDDMFRAKVISQVQGDEAIALAFLFLAQWLLLLSPILNTVPVFLQVPILLGIGLCAMSYLVGLISYLSQGKLGGTVSGWPWQKRNV